MIVRGGTSALVTAGWLVPQVGDVLAPLLGREATGGGTNPLDGVLDVQVPDPDHAVVVVGQYVSAGAERHPRDGGGAAAGQGLAERAGVPPIVVDDVDTPSMNARDSYGERGGPAPSWHQEPWALVSECRSRDDGGLGGLALSRNVEIRPFCSETNMSPTFVRRKALGATMTAAIDHVL
jgi:hypothetical protein